jgi:hypothetical protein
MTATDSLIADFLLKVAFKTEGQPKNYARLQTFSEFKLDSCGEKNFADMKDAG